MYGYTRIQAVGLTLLLLSLAACSLAPRYVRPDMPVPQGLTETKFRDTPGVPSGASFDARRIGWRDFFKDEQLQEYIAASLHNNRDVQLAALAIREARARYGVQNSERFPQLNADGANSYSGGFRTSTERSHEASVTVPAFELDFFGRLQNMSESALQQYLATREAEKAARIALVSQVAQGWLAERLARERLRLTENNLKNWRTSYAFIEERVRSGQSSLLELEQARSQVEFASASVAQRQREVTQAVNALYPLLGSFAKREAPATALAAQRFAELPDEISSVVLLDRPDVMEAEHTLLAANADIGAARAAFFPSISLTGNLGYMSEDLNTLFSGATSAWSFLPRVSLPIFTAGRNSANLELAEIRRESSVVQYEKTLQNAFREVADALMTRASFTRQFESQKKYLASQRVVLELATSRYVSGAISYLEVLDAQRGVFQAELDLLDIRREQLVNDITLYSALGGGLIESAPETAP